MRTALLLFASTTLAGAVALSGCSDNGMFGKSSTATPSTAAQQAAAQPVQQPSSDVRDSQQQLKSLGYYDGPVDGLWGPETQSAVERYQRERGLSASGRIDTATRDSLRETTAGRAGTMASGTVAGTGASATRDAQAPITLTNETDVRTVQNRLGQLNFYQGPASGAWNSETQAAVENFQRARGLPVGQLNLATLNAMGLDTMATSNQRPAGTVATAPGSTQPGGAQVGGVVDRRSGATTGQGTTGQATSQAPREANISPAAGPGAGARAISPRALTRTEVRDVQQKLAEKGYYKARVDGAWGPNSHRALVNFQTQNNFRSDGQIDAQTANALGFNLQRVGAAGVSPPRQ